MQRGLFFFFCLEPNIPGTEKFKKGLQNVIHITVYNMNGQLYFHLNSTHLMLWEGDVRCARQKKFFNCLNMPIFSGFCNCIYST